MEYNPRQKSIFKTQHSTLHSDINFAFQHLTLQSSSFEVANQYSLHGKSTFNLAMVNILFEIPTFDFAKLNIQLRNSNKLGRDQHSSPELSEHISIQINVFLYICIFTWSVVCGSSKFSVEFFQLEC